MGGYALGGQIEGTAKKRNARNEAEEIAAGGFHVISVCLGIPTIPGARRRRCVLSVDTVAAPKGFAS